MDKSTHVKPLEAAIYGALAGLIGSAAQNLFFKLSASKAPSQPEGVFEPPEDEQKSETSLQTVARRFVEGLMQRGPLPPEQKAKAGHLVHFAFGGAWGSLYGMLRESFPHAPLPSLSLGFSTAVWMISDNLILPAFRLSAWPQRYPPKTHFYAWTAHLAYGAAVSASYAGLVRGQRELLSLIGSREPAVFQTRPFSHLDPTQAAA